MKEIFSFDEFFYDKKVDFNFYLGGSCEGFWLKIEGEASWCALFDKNFEVLGRNLREANGIFDKRKEKEEKGLKNPSKIVSRLNKRSLYKKLRKMKKSEKN